MHIAPVWPSTVKESNRQIRSTDPAAMHGSIAAMSGTWFAKSCGPFLRERSASPDHRVGHAFLSDIEAYFDRRAKIITRGERCRSGRAPGAGSHIGFLERYGSNDPSLTAANPLTSKDRGTRFMACIAMS
jgi:hypothetical protein